MLHQIAGHLTAAVRSIELVSQVSEQRRELERRILVRSDLLDEQYRRQNALLAIEDVMRGQPDIDTILDGIVEVIRNAMAASFGASIFIWDPVTESFSLHATSVRTERGKADRNVVRSRAGTTRWVYDNGLPVVIKDVSKDPGGQNPTLLTLGVNAFIAVPIHTEDVVLGVLYVLESDARDFVQADVDFALVLANRAGLGLSRIRLMDQLKTQNRKLNKAVNLMTGREVRMRELKRVIRALRAKLNELGQEDNPDDPMAH